VFFQCSIELASEKLHAAHNAIRPQEELGRLNNPFTTLQVVLEPTPDQGCEGLRRSLSLRLLEGLARVCQDAPTYLDRFYGLQPGRPNGAKRLIVVLPACLRGRLDSAWVEEIGTVASVAWRGNAAAEAEMEAFEYAWKDSY